MGTTLRIHTLGGLTIERDGHPITDFDSRKVQALLVYLACSGRAYPRDVLAEFFWEERTQSQALANLRVALTSLRQTVEPFVDISRDAVGLQPDGAVWLDASAFEEQLDAAGTDASLLNESLDLYHGDFLAGFYVDSNAFEDWATRERERLRLCAIDGLDRLVACYAQQQDFRAGIATANRLLALDPLREETHRLLMQLLWHAGQRGKALEQYETLCTLLRDELGVEPTAETTALYQRIRAGESPVPPTDRHAIRGYDLRERIGSGGFGEVYRAFQPVVNREVAIKVIKPEFANHPDFIRRFETEGQLVARLEHPHIVPLYDYWREPGGAFLVMRLLRRSLADRLAHGPLSVSECTRLVEQVAAALTVAHRAGVVHRDVKPANILLDDEGNAYLTDFGIAKVLGPALQATQEGMLVGSPTYLAPEQVRGDPVEPRADLYSFGVLLFEALTGQPPFPDTLTPSQLLYKQLNEPLPSVVDVRPDLPPALDSVLQRATAKDPTQRFRDALELASAFRQAAGPAGLRPSVEVAAALQPRERPDERTWTPADSLVLQRNPYKGLRAFEEADAADFFGREALVEHLLACLSDDDPLARFLAVVGPSGSGKSSVVKAGLIPALRQGQLPGSEAWFIAELQPGPRPLDRLEVALLRVAATQPPGLMEQLLRDAHGLTRAAEWILPEDATLLLVIDQFEELFTLADDPRRARHLLALLEAAVTDPRGQVRVLLTLRADFYDRPLMVPGFCDLIRQRTEVVVPLTAEELERAISIPAEQVGVRLEPGLAAAMVADVHEQPGALPMLQFALTELFEQRADHTLTLDAYRALGGVEGALAQQAERVFGRLDASAQAAARQLFLRLVTLGEGSEDTRRRALQAELLAVGGEGQLMPPVIDAFDRARLLTFDHDPVTRGPTVEVAHEALLREWDRLRSWLDDSRHDIRQQRLLAAAASEWERAAQDRSYLLSGARLAEFEGWATTSSVTLTENEQAFLDASVAEHRHQIAIERQRQARELELQRRAAHRLRYLVAGLAIFLVAAIGLSLFALGQQRDAENARATSDANVVIAQENASQAQHLALINGARAALEAGDLDTALALAVEANHAEVPSAAAQLVLAQTAYGPPRTVNMFQGYHGGQLSALAFSPDGSQALSGGWGDLTVKLWDVATGELLHDMEGHTGSAVSGVAFHPTEPYAITTASEIFAWDLRTGELLRQFESDQFGVPWFTQPLFSPDGRTFITDNGGGAPYSSRTENEAAQLSRLLLWDFETGELIRTFEGHSCTLAGLAISPDGAWVYGGVWNEGVVIWDVETGAIIGDLNSPPPCDPETTTFADIPSWISGIAVSPDGSLTVTERDDGFLTLWDLGTSEVLFRKDVPGNMGHRANVVFSPDGRTVLAASADGVIEWDVATGESQFVIPDGQFAVAFSPSDSQVILAGGGEAKVRLWDLQHGALERRYPVDGLGSGWYGSVYINPDESQFAVCAEYDPNAESCVPSLYDLATGERIQRLETVNTMSNRVGFSPDGRLAVISANYSGAETNLAVVWDLENGRQLLELPHEGAAMSAVFSPDGRTIVSGQEDGVIIQWDASTGQEIRRLEGHVNQPNEIVFSPDGETIASAGQDALLILWDADTGQELLRMQAEAPLDGAEFSADGSMILSCSMDYLVRLWDVATGQEIRRFIGHPAFVSDVHFSPDGQTIFSSQQDGVIIQWDLATGQMRNQLPGTSYYFAVSADGRSVFTSGPDSAVYQYRVDTAAELLAWTEAHRYIRDFTCDERALYQILPLCD